MIKLISVALVSMMLSKSACVEEKSDESYVSIVVIAENSDKSYIDDLKKVIEENSHKTALKFTISSVILAEGEEYPCFVNICSNLTQGLSLILDLSWRGWTIAENTALRLGVPYIRVDITIQQLMHAADDYLQNRNATDAALIFQNDNDLEQALLYLVGNSIIRLLVLDGLNTSITENLRAMRPMPTNYVILGSRSNVAQLIAAAIAGGLVIKDSKWAVVFEEFHVIEGVVLNGTWSYFYPDKEYLCCKLSSVPGKDCVCNKEIRKLYANKAFQLIHDVFRDIKAANSKIISIQHDCKNAPEDVKEPLKSANETFTKFLQSIISERYTYIVQRDNILLLNLKVGITSTNTTQIVETMGTWSTETLFTLDATQVNKTIRNIYNIGVAVTTPFTFYTKLENGTEILDGFCIQLVKEMAKKMDFDFNFVFPENNSFGERNEDGTWDGLIGDLMNGTTDIVVAALTMTSEREEAIDFVAPHFDQTGISIVMKKAEKEVSLFKFMSVLEAEVWWCILGAIIVTAIVLWLLDKYSPFSGQNKKRYPYETRKFTLVECFWFALTSITPQGGGEPPKAISGRILVAAYWLFVVLMLATFTANLAAFLTVERMQTPVKSLEDLAKQSKINYTVVKGSSIEQYFQNMAAAENDLYRVWKDMTLNTSTDQAKYRVWDYPIKEQYNRIYDVIKKSGFMMSTEEGFQKVKNDKDGSFAFIHDAAEIKYEVYRSCDLLEVGEVFAEQPYAIAVQSGSHLQEEISKVLLDLQKDRYFEQLYNQFWNATKRRECPNYEDTEGITLQSLGGVFIATLVGLTIGMLTLIGEVVLSKKKQKDKIQPFVQVRNKQPSANILDGIRTRTIHPRPRLAYNF